MTADKDRIFRQLKDILYKVYPTSADLIDKASMDSNLANDLNLNSIGMLCLVIMIEETFGMEFSDVGLTDFIKVSDVVDYIQSKLN